MEKAKTPIWGLEKGLEGTKKAQFGGLGRGLEETKAPFRSLEKGLDKAQKPNLGPGKRPGGNPKQTLWESVQGSGKAKTPKFGPRKGALETVPKTPRCGLGNGQKTPTFRDLESPGEWLGKAGNPNLNFGAWKGSAKGHQKKQKTLGGAWKGKNGAHANFRSWKG